MRIPQDNHLGFLVRQISQLTEQLHNKKLELEGVTASQERVLFLLYKNDGATQSKLSQDLFIKPSSLTKSIDILEDKGLVKRVSSIKDARVKKIILTDKGRQLEKKLWLIKEELEENLSRLLTNNELNLLTEYLKLVKKGLLNHNH